MIINKRTVDMCLPKVHKHGLPYPIVIHAHPVVHQNDDSKKYPKIVKKWKSEEMKKNDPMVW
jgi:hypothetical protein